MAVLLFAFILALISTVITGVFSKSIRRLYKKLFDRRYKLDDLGDKPLDKEKISELLNKEKIKIQ